jgi:hypothetical protein
MLAATGLALATVRHAYRAVFKSVLTNAIDDGLLARSPCHRIELPAADLPAIEPLTPAQILTLATMIDHRYRAMVLLAAGCRLRWSEAAGLTCDRTHLGARTQVTIGWSQKTVRPAALSWFTTSSASSRSSPTNETPTSKAWMLRSEILVMNNSLPQSYGSCGHLPEPSALVVSGWPTRSLRPRGRSGER